MNTITKLLALMPLVALGAACNGTSPSAPGNPLTGDEGAAFDMTVEAKTNDPSPCRDIAAVDLKRVPSFDGQVVIQATYLSSGSVSGCAAPVWTSDPRGILTNRRDPFTIAVNTSVTSAIVFATAPNGVEGQIKVQ